MLLDRKKSGHIEILGKGAQHGRIISQHLKQHAQDASNSTRRVQLENWRVMDGKESITSPGHFLAGISRLHVIHQSTTTPTTPTTVMHDRKIYIMCPATGPP